MKDNTTLSRRRVMTAATLMMAAVVGRARLPIRQAAAQDGAIAVTTTIGMVNDIVRNVGGDLVETTALMGPGIDPHLYKPSAGDVRLLTDADIIFYGGLHLEGRMGETLEQIGASGTPTIPVSENAPQERLLASVDYADQFDPHIWFDVSLWTYAVDAVAVSLADHAPDAAETVQANAIAYRAELDELHAWVTEQANRVPDTQRVLVTAHDAFRYFGAAYGFEVRGVQGLSTASEAGAGDVQDLARFIADRQIRAMFVESSVPRATIEAVQEACRANGWDVQIGGELYSDAMGEEGTEEGTYIGMVRHNVTTIVSALLGEGVES